jgi:hypothetical protein
LIPRNPPRKSSQGKATTTKENTAKEQKELSDGRIAAFNSDKSHPLCVYDPACRHLSGWEQQQERMKDDIASILDPISTPGTEDNGTYTDLAFSRESNGILLPLLILTLTTNKRTR